MRFKLSSHNSMREAEEEATRLQREIFSRKKKKSKRGQRSDITTEDIQHAQNQSMTMRNSSFSNSGHYIEMENIGAASSPFPVSASLGASIDPSMFRYYFLTGIRTHDNMYFICLYFSAQ